MAPEPFCCEADQYVYPCLIKINQKNQQQKTNENKPNQVTQKTFASTSNNQEHVMAAAAEGTGLKPDCSCGLATAKALDLALTATSLPSAPFLGMAFQTACRF